ncbi:tubulin polyglutamylase complex subunit 1 isoform X2 [Magallana gigas]|uniref:Tubulin polyglutamylase complex subunit 1-like C-terminal domain-containing protein n=1 Tax=Magallana gigas TaxID=29159 RepID=A0A8W8LC60_MAGGI|nr:tubulin polyglutamylase complex subunit 1 isoform X2 [Crassostrea gigas]|eukprot:XP_011431151.1 PREDICTED: tubulin polyglutamylase complex subunit 1 isoform X2 [Crassostrea gigas]
MADKKKPNSADDRPQETDRQFLERYSIGTLMKDVLGKIVSNRPKDPITFLSDYFDSLEDQSNLVLKARNIIEMTHHSRPVFEMNVRQAYDIMLKQKDFGRKSSDLVFLEEDIGKRLYGVNGTSYTDLIKTLCRDMPQPVTTKLLKKIECLDYEAITFDVFKSGVFTCCVLQDYVKLCEMLFNSLDFQSSGKVDKILSDVVNEQLKAALANTRTDARKIVEAGYNLGPDGLFYALERGMRSKSQLGGQTLEQFTIEICDAFLSKVKRLR